MVVISTQLQVLFYLTYFFKEWLMFMQLNFLWLSVLFSSSLVSRCCHSVCVNHPVKRCKCWTLGRDFLLLGTLDVIFHANPCMGACRLQRNFLKVICKPKGNLLCRPPECCGRVVSALSLRRWLSVEFELSGMSWHRETLYHLQGCEVWPWKLQNAFWRVLCQISASLSRAQPCRGVQTALCS